MRSHKVFAQNSPLVKEFYGSTAILLLTVLDFLERFRKVSMQDIVFFASHLCTALEDFFANRINAVRHHGELDAVRFKAVILQELEIFFNMFGRIQVFGNRYANRGSNSHFLHHLHGDFATPVHVRKKDGSGLDHFKHGKARSDFDILRREFRLERPDVFCKPFLERHIVGIATQKRHGGMSVAIVERRHYGKPIALDNFGILVIALGKFTTNLGKFLARNQNILFFPLKKHGLEYRFRHNFHS